MMTKSKVPSEKAPLIYLSKQKMTPSLCFHLMSSKKVASKGHKLCIYRLPFAVLEIRRILAPFHHRKNSADICVH